MGEPFIGEIKMTSFNFAPRGWAVCDGRQLMIMQNQALFSLLAVAFGGDGKAYFNLPDLRGRAPVFDPRPGKAHGMEGVSLSLRNMPTHNHTVQAYTKEDGDKVSLGVDKVRVFAKGSHSPAWTNPSNLVAMGPGMITITGKGRAHDNMQPSLVLNFIIALSGTYPMRS